MFHDSCIILQVLQTDIQVIKLLYKYLKVIVKMTKIEIKMNSIYIYRDILTNNKNVKNHKITNT